MAARITPYTPRGLNLWVLNNLPNCGRSSQRRPSRNGTRSGRQRVRTPARSRPAIVRLAGPNRAGTKAATSAKAAPAKPSAPVDPVIVAIGKLQRRFPRAFPKNPAPKVPLKVGIWEDLAREAQTLGLSEAELRDAMSTWCRGNRYWSCLVEDAVRVDLQGNEAGRVTRDDAARARHLKSRRPGKGAAKPAKGTQQPKADAQTDAAVQQPAAADTQPSVEPAPQVEQQAADNE